MNFLPVILGSDHNAYGVARSFHEAYGVSSLLLAKKHLPATDHSRILTMEVSADFDRQDVFLPKMIEVGKRLVKEGQKNLLVSCGDGYTELLIRNRAALAPYFTFNYLDEKAQKELENKEAFYQICAQYGLDYPETTIIKGDHWQDFPLPDQYPVALKADNSIEYLHLQFEGKEKAYKIQNQDDLLTTVRRIYAAGYRSDLIMQDWIPGDSSAMYVLNCYVDQKGKVRMMNLGRCLLDECLPQAIGNYNALISQANPEIYQQYQRFLEGYGYRGFANFDLKYDIRDGRYKVFEINLRQGQSSFYMTAGGCNFVTYLVEDMIEGQEAPVHYHETGKLWLNVDPTVLIRYCNPSDRSLAQNLVEKGFTFTQWYKADRNLFRFLNYWRRRFSTRRYYPKFEPARQK